MTAMVGFQLSDLIKAYLSKANKLPKANKIYVLAV